MSRFAAGFAVGVGASAFLVYKIKRYHRPTVRSVAAGAATKATTKIDEWLTTVQENTVLEDITLPDSVINIANAAKETAKIRVAALQESTSEAKAKTDEFLASEDVQELKLHAEQVVLDVKKVAGDRAQEVFALGSGFAAKALAKALATAQEAQRKSAETTPAKEAKSPTQK